MDERIYNAEYAATDFRAHPERYRIGRGEQGVLIVEPYKSEILPHWRFRTPLEARASAKEIYELYIGYRAKDEFVGMDMARKYLQMGFTRARRYANHPSGTKYKEGLVVAQTEDWQSSDKAKSAQIFKEQLDVVRQDQEYIRMKEEHENRISL